MSAICPNGHQSSDDSLFCNTCASPIEKVESARTDDSASAALHRETQLAQPQPTPSISTRLPLRAKIVLTGVSTLAVLAIAAAVTLGVLLGNAGADLRNAQGDLRDAQNELSATKGAKYAFDALERDARYTACAKFYAGFAMGKGLDNDTAGRFALDTCADESAWELLVDTAPQR